jgi:MFS family permease
MSTSVHALCHAAYAQAADGKRGPIHPRLVIATTILASSLAFIGGSVVKVGLPAIGASFQADAAGLQWVVNAYLLPPSALLLLGGAAGDRFGRRLLVAGVSMFGLSVGTPAAISARATPSLAFDRSMTSSPRP